MHTFSSSTLYQNMILFDTFDFLEKTYLSMYFFSESFAPTELEILVVDEAIVFRLMTHLG